MKDHIHSTHYSTYTKLSEEGETCYGCGVSFIEGEHVKHVLSDCDGEGLSMREWHAECLDMFRDIRDLEEDEGR